MTYDPQRHHRRSIRLTGYDYSQAGAYFFTVCAQDRACLFGEVVDGQMHLNDAGRMVLAEWTSLPVRFPGVELDAFCVMPNHLHGIIAISTAGLNANADANGTVEAGLVPAPVVDDSDVGMVLGATTRVAPTGTMDTEMSTVGTGPAFEQTTESIGRPVGATLVVAPGPAAADVPVAGAPAPLTLGDIVGAFKSVTTGLYIQGVRQSGWTPFRGRLWQRNYHEHIIRNHGSLNRIRQYILDNPARWASDRENPEAERPEKKSP